MANFSDKADEVVGRAKQAAGDLTGNDELRAEGTADKTRAQVKQGVDAAVDTAEDAVNALSEKASSAVADAKEGVSDTVDKASEQVSVLADKATDTAEQLHLDDKRYLVVAAIAGITLTLLIRKVRGNRQESRGTATKRAIKRAAKTSLGRALNS